MIPKTNFFVLCLFVFFHFSCNKNDEIEEIKISNNQLQEYLLKMYDSNNDGVLSKEEALEVTDIFLILDKEPFLNGLESFPNLENLSLLQCEFSSIDLSKNNKLRSLGLENNRLKSLDLSNNPELRFLHCRGGELQNINLGQMPNLSSLICSDNKLTELDISGCPQLILLECSGLNRIDVKNNTLLESLFCRSIQSATLDLSNNPFLVLLQVTGSMIETLELCGNANLETLECWGMPKLTTLDVSNIHKLSRLECVFNPVMTTLYLQTGQTIERLNKDEHTIIVYKEKQS